MLLKEPYQFKTLKLVNNAETVANINRYITIDYVYIKEKEKIKIKPFSNHHLTLNPVILYGLSDVEKSIPVFNHPIVNVEHKWIALDLRSCVQLSDDKESYEIRNESEFNLALQRFILTAMWFVEKESALYTLKLAHFAFANWLSDNLTKKFGLDMNNQLQLKILALIYYSRLFTDTYTEDDFTKLLVRSKDEIVIPKLLEEVRDQIGDLETIDDFCKACYDVTKNIRLKNLDYNVMVNIVANNWVGGSGKELAMLSLEHPPTWISLVYSSLTQRSFKKSYITGIVDKMDKRGKGEEFLKALIGITKDYKEE